MERLVSELILVKPGLRDYLVLSKSIKINKFVFGSEISLSIHRSKALGCCGFQEPNGSSWRRGVLHQAPRRHAR
jgi:hypothetical protein